MRLQDYVSTARHLEPINNCIEKDQVKGEINITITVGTRFGSGAQEQYA